MTWHTNDFEELPVYEKLLKLARNPFDLTAPGALSPERIGRYKSTAAGFDLLYSTQRLDEAVLGGLQQLADQAGVVEQFLAMKRGEVMNRIEGYDSENRRATARRRGRPGSNSTGCRLFSPVLTAAKSSMQPASPLPTMSISASAAPTSGPALSTWPSPPMPGPKGGSASFPTSTPMTPPPPCRGSTSPGPWWGSSQRAARPWKR